MGNLDDKIVLLVAFVLTLAAVFFLTVTVGANDVKSLGLVAIAGMLAGGLAALVRR